MIDPREKERLFQEAIATSSRWLDVIAQNNGAADSWQDLVDRLKRLAVNHEGIEQNAAEKKIVPIRNDSSN